MNTPETFKGHTQKEVIQAKRKVKGKVLSDAEIVNLVADGSTEDIGTSALWYGYGIKREETPIARLPVVIDEFIRQPGDDAKRRFLVGAGKFLFKAPVLRYEFQSTDWKTQIDAEHVGIVPSPSNYYSAVCALLDKTLVFTKGNVGEALKILSQGADMQSRPSVRVSLSSIYRLGVIQEKRVKSLDPDGDNSKIIDSNPDIRRLAFRLDVEAGSLWPTSHQFYQLIDDVFPRADGVMKTEILAYLKRLVLNGTAKGRKLVDVKRLVKNNTALYTAVKKQFPNSQFVNDYEAISAVIRYDELAEKTAGGSIEPDELVRILEGSDALLKYVSVRELEVALDSVADHLIAQRINRLLKRKTQQEISDNTSAQETS